MSGPWEDYQPSVQASSDPSGPWNDFNASNSDGPWHDFQTPEKEKSILDYAKNTGVQAVGQLAQGIDTGLTYPAAGLARMFGGDTDTLFKEHEDRIKADQDFIKQHASNSGMGEEIAGSLLGLPGQIPTMLSGNIGSAAENIIPQGGSVGQALGVGTGQAVAGMAGALVPGGRLLQAGANVASGALGNLASNKYLESQGLTDAAKAYDPLDLKSAITNAAAGALLGGNHGTPGEVPKDINHLGREDLQSKIDSMVLEKAPVETSIKPWEDFGNTAGDLNKELPLPKIEDPLPPVEQVSDIQQRQQAAGLTAPEETPLPKLDTPEGELVSNREDFSAPTIGTDETGIPSHMVDLKDGNLDTNKVLDYFSNYSVDPGYASLAEALKGKLDDVVTGVDIGKDGNPSELHTNTNGNKVIGSYYNDQSLIMLGTKGMTDRAFLHEAVHAATGRFLRAFPDSEGSIALNDLYRELLPKASEDGLLKRNPDTNNLIDSTGYGMHNVDEFVAEAMTNKDFQDWLKTHDMTGKEYQPMSKIGTAWNAFKSSIAKLFNLKPEAYTALDKVLNITGDIMQAHQDYKPAVDSAFTGYMKKIFGVSDPSDLPDNSDRLQSSNDIKDNTLKSVKELTGITKTFDTDIKGNIDVYRAEKDISNDTNSLKSGTQFTSLLNNRNALVRDVGRVFRTELNASRALEAKYLTNKADGVLALAQKLSSKEFTDLQMVMRASEGKLDLTLSTMKNLGLNDKQIQVATRMREVLDNTLQHVNDTLIAQGRDTIPKRAGYLPGSFKGDFRTLVTDANGKFITVISDNNRRTLQKIVERMQKENPDYKFEVADKQFKAGEEDRNSFAAFETALAIIGDSSPDAQRILASYADYKANAAFDSTSMKKHFLEKRGGLTGAEGFKPWKNDIQNAKEGFKAFHEYVDTANKWVAVNRAIKQVEPVFSDPQVMASQPNSLSYLDKYISTVEGKPNAAFLNGIPKGLEDVVNGVFNLVANKTGLGPTLLKKPFNELAKYTQLAWMGMRPVFSAVQMLQYSATWAKKFHDMPIQAVIMGELKGYTSGVKMLAQVKSDVKVTKNGIEINYNNIKDPFDREMYRYMRDTGLMSQSVLMDVKDLDQPQWLTKAQNVASYNMKLPELLTRTFAFTTFAKGYKEMGVTNREAFEMALEASDFTMSNYHPEERPLIYQQGWASQKIGALQTYKHNQLGQIRSYFQDAKSGKPTGLALYSLTMLAMGGAIGLPFMQQIDTASTWLAEHLFKEDFSIKRWLMINAPEMFTRGAVSNMTRKLVPEGIDLASSMSAADMLSTGGEGYITDNIKKVIALVDLAKANTNAERALAAKDLVPMQFKGLIENNYLSKPLDNGKVLTANSKLEGDYQRSPNEQLMRNLGATSVKERTEKDLTYTTGLSETRQKELQKEAVQKLAALYYAGKLNNNMDSSTLSVYQKAVDQYTRMGGDPKSLQDAVLTEAKNQNIDALTRGIGKPKSISTIDKAQNYLQGRQQQ